MTPVPDTKYFQNLSIQTLALYKAYAMGIQDNRKDVWLTPSEVRFAVERWQEECKGTPEEEKSMLADESFRNV